MFSSDNSSDNENDLLLKNMELMNMVTEDRYGNCIWLIIIIISIIGYLLLIIGIVLLNFVKHKIAIIILATGVLFIFIAIVIGYIYNVFNTCRR